MLQSNNTSMVDISEDEYQWGYKAQNKVEVYILISILIFLSIVGTAGNLLVLYVFSKKRDKLVSTLFILVMAFVDFITCLVVIPYTAIMEYSDFWIKYDFMCKLYHFLITSNIPFSALIMVAIAIDRYLCICHPFYHILTVRRAKYVTAVLGVFAAVIGVLVALLHGVTIEMSVQDFHSTGLLGQDNSIFYNTQVNKLEDNSSKENNVTIRLNVVLSEQATTTGSELTSPLNKLNLNQTQANSTIHTNKMSYSNLYNGNNKILINTENLSTEHDNTGREIPLVLSKSLHGYVPTMHISSHCTVHSYLQISITAANKTAAAEESSSPASTNRSHAFGTHYRNLFERFWCLYR